MRPLTRFISPLLIALIVLLGPAITSHAQTGPGVTRTTPAIFSIDIARYGAAATSTFDNTLAIQTALDAVHAAGGGEVTITRPGDYIVTDYLTSAGAVPTAPNTTLNSCLVIYSNTTIRMAAGARIVQGLVRDDSKCYLLRNADPTNGNTNIRLVGGGYSGGGVVAEATVNSATSISIAGDYSAKVVSGATCYINTITGKWPFTVTSSTYANSRTTITGSHTGATADTITGAANGAEGVGYFSFAGDIRNHFAPTGYLVITGNGANGTYTISDDALPLYVSGSNTTRVYVHEVISGSNSSGTATTGMMPGGFQCSWQAGNTLNLAITARNVAAGTITVTDNGADLVTSPNPNYTGLIGAKCYVTQNTGASANTLSGYTVASVVDNGATSTITMTGALEASTAADGYLAFNYNQLWYQDGLYFNNVTQLTLTDLTLGGWDKYAAWLVNVRGGDFQNIVIDNGSDGLHVGGLCSDIVAHNIRGRTLDNLFPLVTSEHWYRPSLYATTCGAISRITLDGFRCDPTLTCVEPIRLTGKSFFNTITAVLTGDPGTGYFAITGDWTSVYRSGDTIKVFGGLADVNGFYTIATTYPPAYNVGSDGKTRIYTTTFIAADVTAAGTVATESRFAISDCTIKGGRGSTNSNAIRLGDDLAANYGSLSDVPMTGILIQDIDMICQNGYAIVDISGSNVRSVTLRDIRLQSPVNKACYVHTPSGQLANHNTWVDQLTIDGLTSMIGTTDKIVQIDAFVNNLVGSNWNLFVGANGQGMLVNNIAAVGSPALYAEGQIYNGSLTNCTFDSRGTAGGTFVNFANTTTTIPSKLQLNNVAFKCSSGYASTAINVAGVVTLQMNDVLFDMATSSSPILIGTSANNAWLRVSGKGVRSLINKAYVYGVSTPTSNSNNHSALNTIYTDIYLPIYNTGTAKLNVACQDFPIDITRTGFTSTVPGNEVTGDCFYNTATQTNGATGSPGAGYMHFVADNGAVGGTSSSGYWEMVGTPKPITTAASITLSAYASKQVVEVTAAATITFPVAKVGMTFTIFNNSSGTVTLKAADAGCFNMTDALNTYTAVATPTVATITNATQGSTVTYKCITATKWNVVANEGVWH